MNFALNIDFLCRSYSTALVSVCDSGLLGIIILLISSAISGFLFTTLVWCNSHTWIYFKHKGRYIKVSLQVFKKSFQECIFPFFYRRSFEICLFLIIQWCQKIFIMLKKNRASHRILKFRFLMEIYTRERFNSLDNRIVHLNFKNPLICDFELIKVHNRTIWCYQIPNCSYPAPSVLWMCRRTRLDSFLPKIAHWLHSVLV